ncbi:MAG TPA: response regulator, partial [Gemmatimonadales bacterium]|nr:response regulator [Gemmatimonadales bacterium]
MPRRSAGPELPVALVVHPDELAVRSLESVLSPAGFSVLRAYSGAEAAAQVRRHRPDAVILGSDLGDATGLALSRTLRGDPEVASSMPIFLVHAGPTSRQDRLEALRAGADDLWSQPLDTEEFVLRLAAAARAKLDADRARKAGLVDPTTGL